MSKQTLSLVGRCRKPHGVHGEIKVESFTDPIVKIIDYLPWQLANGDTVTVKNYREVSKGLLVTLEGRDTIEDAELLTNMFIYAELPPLKEEDGYYWRDLIGMTVFDPNNVNLGVVDSLTTTHTHDLMIVQKGTRVIYVPFSIPDVIEQVDPDKKQIRIHWHEVDFND